MDRETLLPSFLIYTTTVALSPLCDYVTPSYFPGRHEEWLSSPGCSCTSRPYLWFTHLRLPIPTGRCPTPILCTSMNSNSEGGEDDRVIATELFLLSHNRWKLMTLDVVPPFLVSPNGRGSVRPHQERHDSHHVTHADSDFSKHVHAMRRKK